MAGFIENYDYASPDKLASQMVSSSFVLSAFSPRPVALLLQNAWPAGTTTLPRRSVSCVDAAALLLFHADARLLTLVTFVGFLILEIGTLVLMAVRTWRRIM